MFLGLGLRLRVEGGQIPRGTQIGQTLQCKNLSSCRSIPFGAVLLTVSLLLSPEESIPLNEPVKNLGNSAENRMENQREDEQTRVHRNVLMVSLGVFNSEGLGYRTD